MVMRRIDRAILSGRVDTGGKLILSGWQKQGMCDRVGSVILMDGDRVILTSRVTLNGREILGWVGYF